MLRKVSQEKKKELKILGEKMKKQGYISQMKSMVSELKQYEVTKEDMDLMLDYAKNKPELYYKLKDISVLYQGFLITWKGILSPRRKCWRCWEGWPGSPGNWQGA
ncbi:hypothetical protein LC724_27595 [Blautia sp. RD014234]|nr:hypothetical protein [Blautia parvula]